MRYVFKILAWTIGVVALIMVCMHLFGWGYLLKGVRVTYLNGYNTAFLEDYPYFDNHTVHTGKAQPWPEANTRKRLTLPDSLRRFHEDISSVAYLLIKNDSIVLETYFDNYGPDSRSNSFSMAKSIVSAILGKVIETGNIKSLDQQVRDFVPELSGSYAAELTFRDLVSMSSGMRWEENYYNPLSVTTKLYFTADLADVITAMPIEHQPGQKFIYQSGDTQLLGIALQRATGKSLSALLSRFFWQPMGAEHDALWQVDSPEKGIEKAYCCLASNARDFARFGKLYEHHGNWNDQQLLPADYVKASLTPRFADAPQYGYGWWMGTYESKPYFYMDGHLGQYVIVIPQDKLIIVRLGHQTDKHPRDDPRSNFQHFIRHAYLLLGDSQHTDHRTKP